MTAPALGPTHASDDGAAAALVVLGAGSFVGAHLSASVADAWPGSVVLVARREMQHVPPGVTAIISSLLDTNAIARQIPAGAVLVNLAYGDAATESDNLALADAVVALGETARASRLVHVSTATVAGRARGPIVTEDMACEPATPYQRTKLAVETRIVARATDMCPVVVLRPSAVFGAGGRNLRMLASQLTRQPRAMTYARACLFGRRPMNLVPVETVVAAIVFAARSAQAVQDRRYLVAADDAPENNFLDVERILRGAFQVPDYALPVAALPPAFLVIAQKLTGRHALGVDVTFDTGRLLRAGLVPPLAFPDALRRYARLLATSADVL